MKYQDEPTNDMREVLESLHRTIVFHSKDFSTHHRDAWLYGVIVGWDCNYDSRPAALRKCSAGDWRRMLRYRAIVKEILGE